MIRVNLRGRIDGAVLVFAKDLAIGVAPRVRIDGVVMVPAKELVIQLAVRVGNRN